MIVTKTAMFRLIAYIVTIVCGLWSIIFVVCFGTLPGRSFYANVAVEFDNIPILHLATPILLSSAISILLLLSSHSNAPDTSRCYRPLRRIILSILSPIKRLSCHRHYPDCEDDNNNPIGIISFQSLSFIIILLPCVLYATLCITRRLSPTYNGGPPFSQPDAMLAVANIFGFVSFLSMSWFLVPVTSHGPILKILGWSEIDAVPLHIWASNIAVGSGCLHGLLYFIRYLAAGNNIIKMIIPPPSCWSIDGLSSTPPNVTEWCHIDTHYCSCSMLFYNFTGVLSVKCFIIVFLTSLHRFRRRYYAMFIKCHFIFGALALLTLICHWPEAVLYLSPSVVYYMVTVTPVMVTQWRQRFFHRGVRIRDAQCLEQSGRCVALTMETTTVAQKALNARACLYVKLCIPRLSAVWHPFTIIPPFNDDNNGDDTTTMSHGDARVVLRAIGPFTKAVEDLVVQGALTTSSGRRRATVLVDGFYGQEPNRLHQALRHDTVVMIAGGVGVTPYLSLSRLLLESILSVGTVPTKYGTIDIQSSTTTNVVLHWVCRDEGLITYFEETFFWKMQRLCCQVNHDGVFRFKVIIHHTKDIIKDNCDVTSIGDGNGMNDKENNEYDVSDVNVIKDRRIGITPPYFTAGEGQSLVQNLPATILFSVLSYLTLVIIYNGFKISHTTGLIYDRLYGILVSIVVTVVISVVADVIMKLVTSIYSRERSDYVSSSSLELTMIDEDEYEEEKRDGYELPRECCNDSNQHNGLFYPSPQHLSIVKYDNGSSSPPPESTTTPITDEDKSLSSLSFSLPPVLADDNTGIMTLEHRAGRPDLAALFRDVAIRANTPGVFMCGPKGLLDEAKRVMLNKRVGVSVYEEIFEV